jgi:G3E family GTPase
VAAAAQHPNTLEKLSKQLIINNLKIPFILVSGFLGSGKTTFLKQVLTQYAGHKKIAIIQNEFAPADIDGIDLKHSGYQFEMLEINNGTVFCVCLLADFITSLKTFAEDHKPDAIFLEASGLADPVAIAEIMQSPEITDKMYLSSVWCIVDVVNFFKITNVNSRVKHQIQVADQVILNKTDLTNNNTETIRKSIQALNPFASIDQASYCQVSIDTIFNQPTVYQAKKINDEPPGRPDIKSGVIKTTKKISRTNFERFIHEFAPHTIRIKGYARLSDNTVLGVQSVYGNNEFIPVKEYPGNTELIFMSEDVELREINKRYKDLAE